MSSASMKRPDGAQPLLDVSGLSVGFRAGEVLTGVDLTLRPGRCLAIVGESGAGKSVLGRTLVGLAGEGGAPARVRADRLQIVGRDMRTAGRRHWRSLRGRQVGFVLQDALGSLDPLPTVGAEVGETLRIQGVRPPARRAAVLGALAEAGLDQPELRIAQRPGELSGGMRQRALVASAIIGEAPLLVADEPTTALDSTIARGVLDLLARLRDAGRGIVFITHDFQAVERLADEVAVLAEGRIVERGEVSDVLARPRHERTRALLAAVPHEARSDPSFDAREAEPVLQADDLHRRYHLPGGGRVDAVQGVDLTVHQGEALGIVGTSGSGKSTLARLLAAAEEPDRGTVGLCGGPWSDLTERQRRPRRNLLRLVPQDPLGSFDPRWTGERILTSAARISGTQRTPRELAAMVHLPADALRNNPRSLSGGQRQRLAIARALAADPAVLVLDEPVSALDVTVQAAILELLIDLQRRTGVAMVLISHDLAVIRRVCHTVAVMSQHRIVERGPVEQIWSRPTHPVTRELLGQEVTAT